MKVTDKALECLRKLQRQMDDDVARLGVASFEFEKRKAQLVRKIDETAHASDILAQEAAAEVGYTKPRAKVNLETGEILGTESR